MRSSATLLFISIASCGGAPSPGPANAPPPPVESTEAPRTGADRAATSGNRGLKEVDANERGLDLRFQLRAHSGGEARYVAPGATLTTGDRVELFIELDQPAHVYVVQFFADETSAVLFPKNDASARLAPGRHRIPAPGKMFELDESTGEEHIYVVASREPLERVDREIAESVNEVQISGAPSRSREAVESTGRRPKKKKKKKPKLLSLGNRGSSKLTRSTETPAVTARADGAGVVVFRFWFIHR